MTIPRPTTPNTSAATTFAMDSMSVTDSTPNPIIVNGLLMDSAKVVVDGVTTYHFETITNFWIASVAIMTLLIVPTLWAKKHEDAEEK